jgi:hypothetical protein
MGSPISINPPTAARHLSQGGSNWLWVATAIFGVSAVLVLLWSTFVCVPYTCWASHLLTKTLPHPSNHVERGHSTILLSVSSLYPQLAISLWHPTWERRLSSWSLGFLPTAQIATFSCVLFLSLFVPELTCRCVRSAVGAICPMVHQCTAHPAVDTYDDRCLPV